jgi:hypothetical protein
MMMNQHPIHLDSPTTLSTSTFKRNRTSILRLEEPVFLVEGSYWPRVLLSDSLDARVDNKRRSSCSDKNRQSPLITKGTRVKKIPQQQRKFHHGNSKRRIRQLLLRSLIKQSNNKTNEKPCDVVYDVAMPSLMPPLLPALVSNLPTVLLIDEQQYQERHHAHLPFRWNPSPVRRITTSCSSLTGKAWTPATISNSRGKRMVVRQHGHRREPLNNNKYSGLQWVRSTNVADAVCTTTNHSL